MGVGILLVVATAGCGESTSGPEPGEVHLGAGNALLGSEADVRLRLEADAFEPGTPVTLILEHHGGLHVGYNLCSRRLERRTAGAWTSVGVLRLCTAHLDLLEAGGTVARDRTLPLGLTDGTYRMRLPLYLFESEAQRDVVSDTFRVEG